MRSSSSPVVILANPIVRTWLQQEGVVAKDPPSPYIGGRTLKWLKVKQPAYRDRERGSEPAKKS